MIKEFKEFISKGSVVDLAVGIVIGSAFVVIINSFVNDILMPPIGLLLGNVDFANLFITLSGPVKETLLEAKAAGAVTINYGIFINAIIAFLIVAFSIFLLIKAINRSRREEDIKAEEPVSKECNFCKMEIPVKAVKCPHCTSVLQ